MPFDLRRRFRTAWRLATLCCLIGSALAAADPAAPAGRLEIRDAWIRWLPANLPAGGYLTLINGSTRPATLLKAASAAFRQCGLHRTLMSGGSMQMNPVERITVPAGASLNFASLGYHLMLVEPVKPVRPGDHVPITLYFADGSSTTVPFEVRGPDAVDRSSGP